MNVSFLSFCRVTVSVWRKSAPICPCRLSAVTPTVTRGRRWCAAPAVWAGCRSAPETRSPSPRSSAPPNSLKTVCVCVCVGGTNGGKCAMWASFHTQNEMTFTVHFTSVMLWISKWKKIFSEERHVGQNCIHHSEKCFYMTGGLKNKRSRWHQLKRKVVSEAKQVITLWWKITRQTIFYNNVHWFTKRPGMPCLERK